MKKIIIACAGGIATSSIIVNEVEKLLKQENIESKIVQCTVYEIKNHLDGADLIITSTPMELGLDVPCVLGTTFLTGFGVDPIKAQIKEILSK
ncbi:MAG: PTS sugar transporter subunit IIB [Erysipelotrichaceae bacterium]|jgi:PTS system galactitol-specific IIB component|nr:PTS sugar transporter subunit IIB [Erysipelotrichaceae bacterium]